MTYFPPQPPSGGDLPAPASQPAAVPPRPWSVSLAVALVGAATVALLISAATGIEEWLRTSGLIDEAARTTGAPAGEVGDERSFTAVFYPIILALHVLAVGAFVGLAIPVWHGRNGARIALCIVAGFSSLCCGGLVALTQLVPDPAEDSAFAGELNRLQENTSPAWTAAASILAAVVLAVAPLVALILLVLPASNRFFRKPPPTDPFGWYGYPYYGYPGQAGAPPPGPPGPSPGPPPGPPLGPPA